MPYFDLFTHLIFSGFDGNIWWWFCYNTESHWEQGDLSATIKPNEEKLNEKESIEIWKRKQGESGPSQWAQQCSSEWGDKELTNS